MLRQPLGLRIHPSPQRSPREQLREAATLGARGVILDAAGELAPDRLGETGRRDLRHLLRTTELSLIALHLPTRRPFDTEDQLDDRLNRADRAFALAYDLGARLVLAQVGPIPEAGESDAPSERRRVFTLALAELARHAEHRGVRFVLESGAQPGDVVREFLTSQGTPSLAASVDPATAIAAGHDPATMVVALADRLAHAYASRPPEPGRAARPGLIQPRGFAAALAGFDWAQYLGSLEEIGYHGFLTVWPDPTGDPAAQFRAMAATLARF